MDSLEYAKPDEFEQWTALREMLKDINRDATATRAPIMAKANKITHRWHRRMMRAKRKEAQ